MSILTLEQARTTIDRFAGAPIVVLGDVMLDQFVFGRVNRISPEAPVPVVEYDHDEFRAGGAANVAQNIAALGGLAELVGVVGDDPSALRLRNQLDAHRIGTSGLVVDRSRPTTTKQRVVTQRNQQVARIDYESDREVDGAVEAALADRLDGFLRTAKVMVISDYLKGAITRALMTRVVKAAGACGVVVLVDPKIPHLDHYAGTSLITPNHVEAEIASHMRIRNDDEAARAARLFRERAGCGAVLITRGEHGMCLFDGEKVSHFPAVAREVADVTGAGDTVIGTLALAIAAGASPSDAAQIANHAAGVVVGKFGPATLTTAELLGAIEA